MNQILFTAEEDNIKSKNGNVAKTFAIVIIIFGLLLIGSGGYQFFNSINNRKKQIEEASIIPEVNFDLKNNILSIDVKNKRKISNIIYNWNDDDSITVSVNDVNKKIEEIELPSGKNTLYIKVIDENGKTSNYSKEFKYEGTYMDVSVVDNEKLKITVTDAVGLQSVRYRWNSEDETEVLPDENDNEIVILTDIPTGLNTISITSVNKENKIQKKEKEVQGITKPVIKVKVNKAEALFKIKLSDDQGLKSYSYKLYRADVKDIAKDGNLIENYKEKLTLVEEKTIDANSEKELMENIKMLDGFNQLELTVKNIEGAEESISGWGVKK